MVNSKAALKKGEEVHETNIEKVDFNNELKIHIRPETVAIIKTCKTHV